MDSKTSVKQTHLPVKSEGIQTPRPRPGRGKSDQFAEQNANAAYLILTDIEKYGGEEALAVRWARRFMSSRDGNYPLEVLAARTRYDRRNAGFAMRRRYQGAKPRVCVEFVGEKPAGR